VRFGVNIAASGLSCQEVTNKSIERAKSGGVFARRKISLRKRRKN
jgi:hypothetical protein